MADFSLSRSTRIQAAPSRIHPLLDDFREWQKWSPWEGLDPNLKREFSGPDHGVGSTYRWSGNKEAGEGEMRMTASSPVAVAVDLDFLKPFKASNVTTAGREGILGGISAGANVFAALEVAKRPEMKGGRVVTVVCDSGDRYMSLPFFAT